MLPPDAICQIIRVAERLDTDHYKVTAEVANAATKAAAAPILTAARGHRNDPSRKQFSSAEMNPPRLVTASFPSPPHTIPGTTAGPGPERCLPSSPEHAIHRPKHS